MKLVVFTPIELGLEITRVLNNAQLPVPVGKSEAEVMIAVCHSLNAAMGISEPEFEAENLPAPIQLELLPDAINRQLIDPAQAYMSVMKRMVVKTSDGEMTPKMKRAFSDNLKYNYLSAGYASKSSLLLVSEIMMQHFFNESLFFYVKEHIAYPDNKGALLRELWEFPTVCAEQDAATVLLFQMIDNYLESQDIVSADFSIIKDSKAHNADKTKQQLQEAKGLYHGDYSILDAIAAIL